MKKRKLGALLAGLAISFCFIAEGCDSINTLTEDEMIRVSAWSGRFMTYAATWEECEKDPTLKATIGKQTVEGFNEENRIYKEEFSDTMKEVMYDWYRDVYDTVTNDEPDSSDKVLQLELNMQEILEGIEY